MPREFIGGSGAEESAPSGLVEVDIDTNCDQCFAPASKVYYNSNKKTLLVVCINDHKLTVQGNWGWIVDG